MKQVWLLLRHYVFWQPIMRPVFGLGVLLTLTGMVWFAYDGIDTGQTLLVLLGSVLMWLFPVMVGSAGFRQAVCNPRIALLPNFRVTAGLALMLLVVIASGAVAVSSAFTKLDLQWQVFAACFGLTSLFIQFSQWWLSRGWGAMTYWLLPVAFAQIWQLPVVRAFWHDSLVLLTISMAAALGWCGLLLWLRRARTIRRVTVGATQQSNNAGSNEISVPFNLLKLGFSGTRSAAKTLLMGGYYNLKNRFGLQLLMLLVMPLMMGAFLLIPALFKGNVLEALDIPPIAALSMGLYASLMGGILSRESTARARFLWLRSPGDRMALWQQLDHMLRGEWLVSIIASSVYAGVVWLLTAMPLHYGVWFILLYGSSLFCLQHLTQYLSIRLTGNLAAGLTYGTLIFVAGALIVTALVTKFIWPIASLCAGFVLLGAVLRRESQHHFHCVDWCQIKPMTISRLAAPTHPAR